MKSLIVYVSIHHENTKKLIDALKKNYDVDLLDAVKKAGDIDFSQYDTIGFASGIYNGSISSALFKIVQENAGALRQKKIFAIITSGTKNRRYCTKTQKVFEENNIQLEDVYQCLGYDSNGLWAKIGGIAKGHPNKEDIDDLLKFVENRMLLPVSK